MYHYLRMEPLFYDGEKHRKFLLLLHLLLLVDIYEAKVIIAVLLDNYIFFYFLLTLTLTCLNVTNWNHKTVILLFILLYLYGVAIMRLAEGCTLLLGPQLLPVLWTALKLKIDKKTKCSRYWFCSHSILLIVNLLHATYDDWMTKTIETTLCRWLTCEWQQSFPITIDNIQ